MKLLLHTCCAPCSIMCIEKLREQNIDVTGFWYNLNIHPYTEYKARRDCFEEYAKSIDLPVVFNDYYGLDEFSKSVINNLDNRCRYCYVKRLTETAKYAKEHGFDAFCTTLLYSPYQKHEMIVEVASKIAKEYGVEFFYQDFRPYFKEGQEKARNLGMYMQKYCGCIYSEEERYLNKIEKDKKKYDKLKEDLENVLKNNG